MIPLAEREIGPGQRAWSPYMANRILTNPFLTWRSEVLTKDRGHPMSVLHCDISDLLLSTNRAVVKSPRGFAKSSYVSKDFPLYLACEHEALLAMESPPVFPHTSITIGSHAGPLAKKWLNRIRREVEYNESIIALYGDLRLKGGKWNEDILEFRNGVEIRAVGSGYQQRGWRPTLFIGDDLDDDEEILSDERLEKAFRWWDGPVDGMLDETHCQCFVIGTPLDEICLLNYIAEKETFEVFEFGAYLKDETGQLREEEGYETWPSKWPHARLQAKAEEIGRRAFCAEYLCQPQPSENPIFERAWFRPYEHDSEGFEKEAEAGFFTVTAIDPAISRKDKADYSAYVTLSAIRGIDKPRIFIRVGGTKDGRWTIGRQVSEGVQIYDDFGAHELVVETIAYQEALAQEFEAYMDRTHTDIRIKRITPDIDKERRAHAVSPMVERGWVYADFNDPMTKRLIDQCVRFKPGQTNLKKDLMDAFVHALGRINVWLKKGAEKPTQKKVLPKGMGRSYNYVGGVR